MLLLLLLLLLFHYVIAGLFLPILQTISCPSSLWNHIDCFCGIESVGCKWAILPALLMWLRVGSRDQARTDMSVAFWFSSVFLLFSFFLLAVSCVFWEVGIHMALHLLNELQCMLNLLSVEINQHLQRCSIKVYQYVFVVFYRFCHLFLRL